MEKKWFVGVDVSKKTIDVVYYDRKKQKMCEEIHRQFSNDQSGFILMRKWFKECGMKTVELVLGLVLVLNLQVLTIAVSIPFI